MSTRHERMGNKSLNEQHAKILKELMQRADNRKCVDCRKKDPRWASWNIGVFMCIRCSGVHRSIGTHITKVKSADLDAWTPEQIANMLKWGNAKANAYWEHLLPAGFEGPPESSIDQWIRDKYDGKRFAMRGPMPDPDSIPLPEGISSVNNAAAAAATATGSILPRAPTASFAQFPPQQQPAQKAQPATNASQDLFDAFQGPSTAAPQQQPQQQQQVNNIKSDIMSLYANPKPASSFSQQQQQQQQQQQLSGLQFFSTTPATQQQPSFNQPQQSFANFASFPAASSNGFASGGGFGATLQPAVGSALFPGASNSSSASASGGIPDFMGLGGVVGGATFPKSSGSNAMSGGGNDKDIWGEFQ
ncbi:hypothetical protein HDU80_010764 [Chytriomyces hyalinus]|nr:hypothetical protein HDU80_010764 [Chytriomyces hyalinus]